MIYCDVYLYFLTNILVFILDDKTMFGYFNPRNSVNSFRRIRNYYKSYYCSTCKALQYNYGYFSKLLLSYDIAIIAMFLNLDIRHTKVFKLSCLIYCGCFKSIPINKEWKLIAALNILTFAEKLKDNLNDDNSIFAIFTMMFFKQSIKNASKDFPIMAKTINEGYLRIVEYEKQNMDVYTMMYLFSEFMIKALKFNIDISKQQEIFIIAIAKWIYLIDALDDYNSDSKKKRFNPFVEEGVSYKLYVEMNRKYIVDIYNSIFRNCLTYDDNYFNYDAAHVLLYQFIPDITQNILNGISLKIIKLKAILTDFRRFSRKVN